MIWDTKMSKRSLLNYKLSSGWRRRVLESQQASISAGGYLPINRITSLMRWVREKLAMRGCSQSKRKNFSYLLRGRKYSLRKHMNHQNKEDKFSSQARLQSWGTNIKTPSHKQYLYLYLQCQSIPHLLEMDSLVQERYKSRVPYIFNTESFKPSRQRLTKGNVSVLNNKNLHREWTSLDYQTTRYVPWQPDKTLEEASYSLASSIVTFSSI